MGTLEAIAQAKGELFMRLDKGGIAVYNADDPLVAALPVAAGVTRVSFGLHGAEVTAEKLENRGADGQRFVLRLPGCEKPINLHAYGRHNVQNALAAAAVAWALGVPVAEIANGLESFRPVDKRFNLESIHGITLIDDSYNANPGSMAAALVTLSELGSSGRAIAVLGDMLELGRGAMEGHREVGRLAATCVSRLYLMGRFAETVKLGAIEGGMPEESIVVADEHGLILSDLRGTLQSGDYVLVKGSRGMKMEVVADGIRAWSGMAPWRGGN
jgi:UDP-N-acetylmuramoyl-tripeptide--D-alanyl-D-alanine ligase